APAVASLPHLRVHVPRPEDAVRRVVQVPVLMKQPALGFHLPEEGSAGVGGEDVERGVLHPAALDPVDQVLEAVRAVVIEAEDEAAIYLDAIVVEDAHAAGVI